MSEQQRNRAGGDDLGSGAAEAEEMPALVRRMDRLELRRRLERFEKWLPTV